MLHCCCCFRNRSILLHVEFSSSHTKNLTHRMAVKSSRG
jgi:hypothetical protein